VKGGERMRVGYYPSIPMKTAAVDQMRENTTQKINEKSTFQQLLSKEHAVNNSIATDFNEKASIGVSKKAKEELLNDSEEGTSNKTVNDYLIELLINNLPLNVAKNINEKLDAQKGEKLFDVKDIVKNIKERLDSSLSRLLAGESQVDHPGQDPMFMSLFPFQQGVSSAVSDEILTKFKDELENILYDVSMPLEEAISEKSSVQPFVLKQTKNRTTLPIVEENDLLKMLRTAQFNKSLVVDQGSGETTNPLLQLNHKMSFMHPLADQLRRANVVSSENMTIKDDVSNMIFTDSGITSPSFQQAGTPIISLNETASKSTVNQQFVQQLLEVMKDSKFTRLANGQSQLIFRLHPEHLGTLTIKLVQENGELMAKIIASSTSAKELIEANIQQIRHAIPAQNITIEKFDVFTQQQTYEPSYREQQGRARDEQHSHQEQHRSSKHTNELDFKDAFTNELVNFEA
jgi:flagellar hook-length control protein FliK